jgi:hypothetical protein
MSEGAADHPEGEKFGRPHEVGRVARMDCARRPAPSFSLQLGRSVMEKFIHRENLVLLKKRLAESHSDAEREVLLKLLADEEAKEPPPKNGNLKPR